jgi:Domain of Unknown Function (DUF1206)
MQLPAAASTATAARDLKQASTRGARAAIRLGYLTRGVVYSLIGTLSLLWALRQSGGRVTDGHGAIERVGEYPWGTPLLWAIAVGLGCYSTWNLVRVVFDPEHHGHDRNGALKRCAYAISAVSQGFLAAYTFELALGEVHGGGQERSIAKLFSMPGGRIAIGIAGVCAIGFGVFELYRAYKNDIAKEYRGGLPAQHRTLICRVARVGLAARGVVFPIIGFSLVAAAIAADPSEAHGFGDALHAIARQAYGRVLLAIVAAGLISYGVHMFFMARYARFPVRS